MVPLRLFCAIWGPKVLPAPSVKTNAWLSTPLCEPPTAPLASPACRARSLPSGLAWGLRQHFPRIWFPPSLWPSCSGCHPTHRLCLCRDLFSNQNESGCGFFICSKEKSYRAVGLGACSGGLNWEQSRACSSVTSTAMRAKAAPGCHQGMGQNKNLSFRPSSHSSALSLRFLFLQGRTVINTPCYLLLLPRKDALGFVSLGPLVG